MQKKIPWIEISISIIAGFILASLAAGLYGAEYFWQGLPGAFALSFISILLLFLAWRVADKSKAAGWIMAAAFLLRLLLGLGLTAWLPQVGYDTPQQKAGYLFRDAFERDKESWGYNLSDESLWDVYWVGFDTDQYGGLLLIGAMVYRMFSPDLHRGAFLIVLSAFFAALAVPFLWKAIRHSWPEKIAMMTVLIYSFYPDSVLYSSSQMREPYVLAFSTIAFWAVQTWRDHRMRSLVSFLASAGLMMLISAKVSLFILVFLLVWFVLEHYPPQKRRTQFIFLAALIVGSFLMVIFSWGWLKESMAWELLVSVQNSGWVQKIVTDLGSSWQLPFLTGYGLVQPLLPAAIAEPSIVLWKTIAIVRAAGWYLILPFLGFGFFSIMLEKNSSKRWLLLWTAIFMTIWLLLSSARAGGDLWDNPRYRLMFLPWMGLFVSWALEMAKVNKNGWLLRWIVLIWSFVALISHWYVGRYTHWYTAFDLKWYLGSFTLMSILIGFQGLYNPIKKKLFQAR